ncbi:MAG: 4-(cytidine 5'-diphospho)-2-C-methyl-D-erythritol kinase [Burkholderiales bacterium]
MNGFSESFSEPYAAPAKLNLMLRVVGRRSDGYHLLQTVFRFIDYGDELRFRVRADGDITRVNDVPGVPASDDLCLRAARALKQASGTLLGADIQLEKRLPLGGGLGGGSSDAATTLLALNHLWKTALSRTQLLDLAVKLGADVPVFVFGENALAEGIGEQLQALELPPAWYVVLCPPVAVSTAAVFSHPELKRDSQKVTIQGFTGDVGGGSGPVLNAVSAVNDLQVLVEKQYPEVARHLVWLAQYGAALMTGSGACVFAPFGSEKEARRVIAQLPADMQGFVASGLSRHPLYELANQ